MPQLSTELMREYDRYLATQPDPSWNHLYYTVSRGRFLRLLEVAEEEPFQSVLEVGTSEFSFMLRKVRPQLKLATLDFHSKFKERCGQANIDFYLGDLVHPPLPVPERSFDVIVFSDVIEHLQGNPRLAVSALGQLLRPGGRLLMATPNFARLSNRIKLLRGITPLEQIGKPPYWAGHFREFVMAELLDFCQTAGLSVVRPEYPTYWDTMKLYLSAGIRTIDENDNFFYEPRFVGWKRALAVPPLYLAHLLTGACPSLRHHMLVVARNP